MNSKIASSRRMLSSFILMRDSLPWRSYFSLELLRKLCNSNLSCEFWINGEDSFMHLSFGIAVTIHFVPCWVPDVWWFDFIVDAFFEETI
jgi:hypothetical protein